MRQAILSSEGDSLALEYHLLNFRKDTSFHSRILLAYENNMGTLIPIYLSKDSVVLERARTQTIITKFHYEELIDSNLRNYLALTRNLPPIPFYMYSSFGEGNKFPVKHTVDKEDFKLQIIEDKDQDSIFRLQAISPGFNSQDSLQLYMIFDGPDSLRRKLIQSNYSLKDSSALNAVELPGNYKSEAKIYYQVSFCGLPLYSSRTLTKKQRSFLTLQIKTVETREDKGILDSISRMKLPKTDLSKYRLPFIRGELLSESHYQNYQNPFSLRPNQYSRLYINLRLNTPLIPLRLSGFLSTENSTKTNLNSFRLTYDKEAFEEKKVLKQAQLSMKLERQIHDQENQIKTLENRAFSYANSVKSGILDDSKVQELQQEALNMALKVLEDSITRKRQLLEEVKKSNDTLSVDSLNIPDTSELDSLERTYAEKKAQLEEVQHKTDSIRALVESSQAKYKEYSETIDKMKANLSRLKNLRQELTRMKSLEKGLSMKQFEVGRINPFISKLTVGGVLVEGAKTELSFNKFNLKAFGGHSCAMPSTKAFITPEELDKSFTRKIGGGDLSYQLASGGEIGLTAFRAQDPTNIKSSNTIDNSVVAFHGKQKLFKNLKVEAEIAYSETRISVTNDENEFTWSHPIGWAGEFKGDYEIKKDFLEVFAEYREVQNDYFSSASPFLRSNYREIKSGSVLQIFDKKLKVKLDYSINRDNLDAKANYTNTMKGWGITLNTTFKKYPNLMVSYQPYSNSSSYIPNPYTSQTGAVLNPYFMSTSSSLLMFNLNYSTKVKKAVLSFNSNTTSSKMSYSGEEHSQLSHSTQVLLFADKHEMTLSINISQIPGIEGLDSMSFRNIEYAWNWQLGKVKIIQGLGHFRNLNDRNLTFQKFGISTQWKSWRFEEITTVGWINRGYFEAKTPMITRLLIGYSF